MSTDTDLRARLHDLADDAPLPALSGADLWRAGARRHRLRRTAAVGAVTAVVALVAGIGPALLDGPGPLPPADAPGGLGLPSVVEPPDPWSEPVAAPGPLSAVSAALHRAPDGLTGSRERMTLFGVSAVDGTARFLDLEGDPIDLDPGQVALSPDGTRVAAARRSTVGGRVVTRGWDVLDTTTGELTRLRVPGVTSLAGVDTYEISFSGDGSHLLTSFSLTGGAGTRDDSLVAWDVVTGDRVAAEAAGHHWSPGPASGPDGVMWTRGRDVLTFDPGSGTTDRLALPQQLVAASFAPDGETLAYISHRGDRPPARGPWDLQVRTPDGDVRRLDVGIEPRQVLGWRDGGHVVVSSYGPREARVVDVVTGEWEPLGISQGADALITPHYATDLLALPVADAVAQPDTGDPRLWMHPQVQWIAVGTVLGGVLQVGHVLRRRRGRA